MVRVVPLALVAALGLAACSGEGPGEDDSPAATDRPSEIGPADSACSLPLTFDVLDGWSADRVTDEEADELAAEGFDQGAHFPSGMRIACEIESRTELGYLRVFTGPAALAEKDPEDLLAAVAAAVDEQPSISVTTTASDSGLEVTEATYAPTDGLHEVRLFLAAGPDGVIVARSAAIDDEESAVLRPVHDLAVSSLRLPG